MNSRRFDVAVVGGGPGGYSAAIRAAQLGLNTVLIDARIDRKRGACLGGTCLNIGCIPSKALLEIAHQYRELTAGNLAGVPKLEAMPAMHAILDRQSASIRTLVAGIASRIKQEGVTLLTGFAKLVAPGRLEVALQASAPVVIEAEHIVLACGAKPAKVPNINVDKINIVTSEQALFLTDVPERLGIVGGGIIGLEMAAIWANLGAEVTVYEALPRLLPMLDDDIARLFKRYLEGMGVKFVLSATTTGASQTDGEATLDYTAEGATHHDTFEKVLVAVGRTPATARALSEDMRRQLLDDAGYIEVDNQLQSAAHKGIWAVGDAVRGQQLAHRALHEGAFVAEAIAGIHQAYQAPIIPSVIYTHLELAWFGMTAAQAQERHVPDLQSARMPMAANGRHVACGGGATGTIKLVCGNGSRILGAQILGPSAGEWIHTLTALASTGGTVEDLNALCMAHPTYAESLRELGTAMRGHAVHIANQV